MGGIKDMLSPHVKIWGGYITPIPPGFTPLHYRRLRNILVFRRRRHYRPVSCRYAIHFSEASI